ncbi:thiamine pyrophosphate-binding protein [Pontivivens ytuae]|uniref:Thiamine pyrophosphate-binding protein n=1 Tax=Pontivivens ytuae TaxID=2789856 RepID=A0A7S9LQG3_9RHOB|nr:thiamine pyrophosphate-binding protein [Pontivivens ytuae]QPH53353.1 thiamine pyrophosphate-binding protein [Pontivivens ytuae]
MNVSDYMARYLRSSGIDTIFGYPGDPSVEFLEGCRREEMSFVLARREGTAGLMAEAYGMLTGRPGVALSTLGPGSTNLVNAVANATLDRTPMIAISGQIDTKRMPTFTHQVVNQDALFSPVSKYVATVGANNVGDVMRKAHRTAIAPRPGAVHLTTPADVVGAEVVNDAMSVPPVRAVGGPADTAEAVQQIRAARRPVILFGISAMQRDAGAELVALAERIGAAIVAAPMAKGTVSEEHPLFAGTLDMACNQIMWDFLDSADLILCAGFDAVELIKPWSVSPPVIHIDEVPNTDQIYAAGLELVGDLPLTLAALADTVADAPGWPLADVAAHREALGAAFDDGRVAGVLNPSDVIRIARGAVAGDAIVTTDVGSHKLLVGQGWRPGGPRRLLMTNGLSSMGFSLPAAITAKMLNRGTEVVCFTGDGGLAMVQSELALAASMKLGLKVVVFLDNSLNRIELKQMARQYASTGTRIDPIDVGGLAGAMGCDGVEVEDETALGDALSTRTTDRPLVIGARIDPAQYVAQF